MSPLFSSRQQPSPRILYDRLDAGTRLAHELQPVLETTPPDQIVAIGLARGGVIVAAQVAKQLDIRLEAIVVRKLGAPDQPELAIGALAASGERVLNARLIDDIGLREMEVDRITARASEAARALCEEIGAPAMIPGIRDATAVLIDDGLATGATMRVAVNAARQQGAARVIVAVPVAPAPMIPLFRKLADDVVTVMAPDNLRAVGQWYQYFFEVSSEEVRATLEGNARRTQWREKQQPA
jgi:putative phosphoribosyl transferase